MRRPAMVLVLAAACSAYDSEDADPKHAADAGHDAAVVGDDSGADVATALLPEGGGTTSCLNAPFTTIRKLDELSSTKRQFTISLSADEKTVYLSRDEGTGKAFEILSATRASLADEFGALTSVPGVNSASDEASATIDRTSTEIVFASSRDGQSTALWRVNRGSTAQPFDAAKVTRIFPMRKDEMYAPSLTSDELWYSEAVKGGSFSFFRSRREGTVFAAPEQATVLNEKNAGTAAGIAFDPDGLVAFVGLQRPDGKGGTDIWTAHRASHEAPFEDIHLVTDANLNTTSSERPFWLSLDGCRLYFSSDRDNVPGANDFFVAERSAL